MDEELRRAAEEEVCRCFPCPHDGVESDEGEPAHPSKTLRSQHVLIKALPGRPLEFKDTCNFCAEKRAFAKVRTSLGPRHIKGFFGGLMSEYHLPDVKWL